MKKLLVLFLPAVAALIVHGQGQFTANNNYLPAGGTEKAIVRYGDGLLPAKVGRVQIINLADGSTLSPNGDAGVPMPYDPNVAPPDFFDGLFFIGRMTVPTSPIGGNADIIVRAWDSSTGESWSQASVRGETLVNVVRLGGPNNPAATFQFDSNFVGMTVAAIPEPGPLTLGLIGLVALAVFRLIGGR